MAPPLDSTFHISKVKGNRKTKLKEEKRKQKWGEMFSVWGSKISQRLLKPADDDDTDQTENPPSTKAADKVLRLPELVGNILKYVDAEKFLTSNQLVNCTWMNTIQNSPALKHKLWQSVKDTRVAQPYGTTEWNGTYWTDASFNEVTALTNGVPAYHGTFAVNMLANPTSWMRREVARKQAEYDAKFPPPPPAPVCPIKAFHGLIRDNFPNLSLVTRSTVAPVLVKPLDYQTSIESTPRGPLVNIGFKILGSLARGYSLDHLGGKRIPTPQPPWLKMFLTDPPVSTVWLSMPMMSIKVEHVEKRAYTRVSCSLRVPSGVTFADVRDAVGKMALADANAYEDISGKNYDVKVSFLADGMVVDGEVAMPATKWVTYDYLTR